jgi:hypothetical protein
LKRPPEVGHRPSLGVSSSKAVRRYLEKVPLTADERAVVEGDQQKIEGFIRTLEGVTALMGIPRGDNGFGNLARLELLGDFTLLNILQCEDTILRYVMEPT